MYDLQNRDRVTIVTARGELGRAELAALARDAWEARLSGRAVVIDLSSVTHLHYAGASLLGAIPGVRVVVASRYVRDLVFAGGAGGYVELFPDVEEALHAA